MSLEATLIFLDNSCPSLNGDYLPTRWESQVDAGSLLVQAKLEANLQSSVGIGLMGGKQPEILCTMTSDSIKANSFLFGCKIHGDLQFTKSLQIGALALKYRSEQTQKQRMVCFIGSKIEEDVETLKILGKKLKKNGIAVDLICFGELGDEQKEKTEAFMKAVEQEDNSHSMIIEPGEVYLSEKLLGCPIFGNAGPGMGAGGDAGMVEDPDLAEAIRQSLALQGGDVPEQPAQQPQQAQQPAQQAPKAPEDLNDEELEQLAIQMSLEDAQKEEPKEEKAQEKAEKAQEKTEKAQEKESQTKQKKE